MSARLSTVIDPATGERVTESDVLTAPQDYQPAPPVADLSYPCDQFLTLRPCTDSTGYGICGQCQKAGLS